MPHHPTELRCPAIVASFKKLYGRTAHIHTHPPTHTPSSHPAVPWGLQVDAARGAHSSEEPDETHVTVLSALGMTAIMCSAVIV